MGSGGREHAIAWRLKRDDPGVELHAAPGNPGIATLATCHAVSGTDVAGLRQLAADLQIDLTIVGPEAPLAAGIVDEFRQAGLGIFGPTAAAARIESSKRFAKELMLRHGVPTARATWHRDAESARRAARLIGAPVVVKASGLAAGKGVVVCPTIEQADQAIEQMLRQRVHGAAGDEILIEEFMEGEELSLFVLTDGSNTRTMLPAQDHKRLLDGDQGPNTGGMGAYAPVGIASGELTLRVCAEIVEPTLAALREQGTPFTGLLYCGLMLTAEGPKVVEYNCRFGDPETQAVLPLLKTPLLDYLRRSARSGALAGTPELVFDAGASVTTVVAAPGYPEAPQLGDEVTLPDSTDDFVVFHAGTKRTNDGRLVTAGGRVVSVTAVAPTLDDAQRTSRAGAERVVFPGRHFRTDIGWRELARRARAS